MCVTFTVRPPVMCNVLIFVSFGELHFGIQTGPGFSQSAKQIAPQVCNFQLCGSRLGLPRSDFESCAPKSGKEGVFTHLDGRGQ